jgi:hypothetical protein
VHLNHFSAKLFVHSVQKLSFSYLVVINIVFSFVLVFLLTLFKIIFVIFYQCGNLVFAQCRINPWCL